MDESHDIVIEFDLGIQSYLVKHNLELIYDLDSNLPRQNFTESEMITGKIGTQTTAVAKLVRGFTVEPFSQQVVAANGETVVEIYYKRNIYHLTLQKAPNDKGILELEGSGDYLYGDQIEFKPTFRPGFGFENWKLVACNDLNFINQLNLQLNQQKLYII